MTAYHCPCCDRSVASEHAVRPADGKAAGCIAGLTLGTASRNPWVALGLALLGAAVGHWIDTEVSPRCPQCGDVLRAILPHVLRV